MSKAKTLQLFISLTALIYVSLLTGCATSNKSMMLGGGIGAGAGAALGGIIAPGKNREYRTRNVIIGSAVGGIAGAAIGSNVFEGNEKKKQDAYEAGQKNAKAAFAKQGTMPELKEAKVEARWIDGKVVGNRYIDGHFEYLIIEPARWDVE